VQKVTIGYGALLTALGVGGFIATGATHKTALIPAGFGVVAIGLGLLAKQDKYRKNALRVAMVVALLGIAGSVGGLKKLPDLLGSGQVERPAAVIAQSLMVAFSATYLALALRSMLTKRN
jgi:hypothetical protein